MEELTQLVIIDGVEMFVAGALFMLVALLVLSIILGILHRTVLNRRKISIANNFLKTYRERKV